MLMQYSKIYENILNLKIKTEQNMVLSTFVFTPLIYKSYCWPPTLANRCVQL
jgi:hypothetical protein